MRLELKYDPLRRFYIRLRVDSVINRQLPADFVNAVRKKDRIECSTMTLIKRNARVRSGVIIVLATADSVQDQGIPRRVHQDEYGLIDPALIYVLMNVKATRG